MHSSSPKRESMPPHTHARFWCACEEACRKVEPHWRSAIAQMCLLYLIGKRASCSFITLELESDKVPTLHGVIRDKRPQEKPRFLALLEPIGLTGVLKKHNAGVISLFLRYSIIQLAADWLQGL